MSPFSSNPTRRLVLGAGGLAAAALATRAYAAYPEQAITVVVPFPPGGPNDVVGRLTADVLGKSLGIQAIVENRAGAGGATGLGTVSRATPDGYTTILASGVGWVTHPLLNSSPSYQVEELRAVSNVTGGPSVLAVRKDLEAKTVKDFVALAKEKPAGLTYASSGVGTTLHLGGELFKKMAGVDLVHIAYKGTSEVLVDLIAGRVDMSIISPLVARKLVDEGRIHALATTGKSRAKGWEDVPTVAEDGVPGYELDSWYPLLVPAKTPDEAVKRLSETVSAGIKAPEAAEKLESLGFYAIGSSVEEAEAYAKSEAEKWGKLIKEEKLKAG